jgi:short-subunit dehydrogenase
VVKPLTSVPGIVGGADQDFEVPKCPAIDRPERSSRGVVNGPQSAVFAMGKFALRGLAQSMARELAPKGIHVAHFVIDGGVRNAEKGRVEAGNMPADSYLDPEAIAQSYLHVVQQARSAWTWEVELRPWVERF